MRKTWSVCTENGSPVTTVKSTWVKLIKCFNIALFWNKNILHAFLLYNFIEKFAHFQFMLLYRDMYGNVILKIIFGIYTRCQWMKVKVRCKFKCGKDIHYKSQSGPVAKNATPRPPTGNWTCALWIMSVIVNFSMKLYNRNTCTVRCFSFKTSQY